MSDEWTVEFDDEAVDKLVRQGIEAIKVAVKLVATDLWGNMREESPVDEGRLAGSWGVRQINDLSWRIFTNVEYALWVYEGTGIFGPKGTPIVPVSASVLVFEIGGETIFARSVKGMKPNPYIDRAKARTEARLDEFATLALMEVGV